MIDPPPPRGSQHGRLDREALLEALVAARQLGLARDLAAVVDFYDSPFAMQRSAQDKSHLVAFRRTL